MKIYKPLTDREKAHNKKHPEKSQIKPTTAFHINEEITPNEAKMWKSLGFKLIREAFFEMYSKRDVPKSKKPNYSPNSTFKLEDILSEDSSKINYSWKIKFKD